VGYTKYLDVGLYLRRDVERAVQIQSIIGKSGSVLDLGSGMAFFPFACRMVGLGGYGVQPYRADWDYSDMFRESAGILEVPILDHMITPFVEIPVPKEWLPLRAVTANQIQFNRLGRGDRSTEVLPHERYGPAEWDFLLKSLAAKSKDGLAVILYFNKPDCWTDWYTPELRAYFQSLGARIDGPNVIIRKLR
jgi:hypothetical protein